MKGKKMKWRRTAEFTKSKDDTENDIVRLS